MISVAYNKCVNIHVRHVLCSKMLNFFYFQLVGRWSNCENAVIMASTGKAKMCYFKGVEEGTLLFV